VYATARKIETLKGLQEAGCEALTLDVTDKLSIEAAKEAVLEKDGRLDVLVNNVSKTKKIDSMLRSLVLTIRLESPAVFLSSTRT